MLMDELNDIFDESFILDSNELNQNEQIENPSPDNDDIFNLDDQMNNSDNSILSEILEARGIKDGKIVVLNDDNEEEIVNFYKLTKDEQRDILSATNQEYEDNVGLDDSEINFINYLRQNNLTVDEYNQILQNQIIEQLKGNSEPDYSIDTYSDHELYLLDLKNKYDLSDEELIKSLEKELEDEDLFKKKIGVLREEYKSLEDQHNLQIQQEAEQQKIAEFEQFSNLMVDVAIATPEFYGIELDDNEKNEVLSYILDADASGVSQFYKELNNPKKLYEAAWFMRYGAESMNALRSAYESEILKLQKKDNKQGKVVVKQNKSSDNTPSIYDLKF